MLVDKTLGVSNSVALTDFLHGRPFKFTPAQLRPDSLGLLCLIGEEFLTCFSGFSFMNGDAELI